MVVEEVGWWEGGDLLMLTSRDVRTRGHIAGAIFMWYAMLPNVDTHVFHQHRRGHAIPGIKVYTWKEIITFRNQDLHPWKLATSAK